MGPLNFGVGFLISVQWWNYRPTTHRFRDMITGRTTDGRTDRCR